jgi:hypothetical protein
MTTTLEGVVGFGDRISSDISAYRTREDTMMRIAIPEWTRRWLVVTVALSAGACTITQAVAQTAPMEQKLTAIKQAQAANKQRLAQYTWQETEAISLKGNVKDTKVYQVRIGADGQPQKTELSDQKAQPSGGRQGRIKAHIVENKKEEYREYGQQIGALAKQYTTPDPERLTQARQAGNISVQPGEGSVGLVIKNYVKQGDSLTMTIDPQTHAPVSVHVNSYLNDPSDAVTILAQFAQLPDGTNHVSSVTINGVSKQLTINEQNANYQKL